MENRLHESAMTGDEQELPEAFRVNSKRLPEKLFALRQKLYLKAKREPWFRFYPLYGLIHRRDVLEAAWTLVARNEGTPQGGVISPLLANLYLHWFDVRFHRCGPGQWAMLVWFGRSLLYWKLAYRIHAEGRADLDVDDVGRNARSLWYRGSLSWYRGSLSAFPHRRTAPDRCVRSGARS